MLGLVDRDDDTEKQVLWVVVDCMQAAKAIFVLVKRLEGSRTNLSV